MELLMPIAVFVLGAYILTRRPQPQPQEDCKRCADATELNAVEEKRMLFDFLDKAHRTSLEAVLAATEMMVADGKRNSDEMAKRMHWERDLERKHAENQLHFQEKRHHFDTDNLQKIIQKLERQIADERYKQKKK